MIAIDEDKKPSVAHRPPVRLASSLRRRRAAKWLRAGLSAEVRHLQGEEKLARSVVNVSRLESRWTMPQQFEKTPAGNRVPWLALLAVPFGAAAAWIAYSALFIDHERNLPPALPGKRLRVATPAGDVCVYAGETERGRPLLLVHSINAAASSYEVRPLYYSYRNRRPVYAIDLPGFGFSERQDRIYTPREMVDALHAVAEAIRRTHGDEPVDVIALSVSCEFAARAALERPELFNSLGLISPTGFDKALSGEGRASSTKGKPFRYTLVSVPLWSQALYDLFVSRPSMRFFLQKTWGSPRIDEGLFEYDQKSSHRPGARHVVWSFLAGLLFADDVSRIYRLLELPVWAVHGTRGDFVDYRYEKEVEGRENWTFDTFDTGSFPHFERIAEVTASYGAFLEKAEKKLEVLNARPAARAALI